MVVIERLTLFAMLLGSVVKKPFSSKILEERFSPAPSVPIQRPSSAYLPPCVPPRDSSVLSSLWASRCNGVYLVFRIEIVDASEVSAQPQCALIVLHDAPDGGVRQPIVTDVVGGGSETVRAPVVLVQPVESSYPDVAQIVFATCPDEVGREAA